MIQAGYRLMTASATGIAVNSLYPDCANMVEFSYMAKRKPLNERNEDFVPLL